MISDRRIRVLHILGALNQGGVETWLLNVLRQMDRSRFQMDFLVHTNQPAAYDEDVRKLGSRIISCPYPHRPWRYARELKSILNRRDNGGYDVVHSHVHDYSGFVLRLASQSGVPVRIVHSHLDSSLADRKSGLLRRRYLGLMRRWIQSYATLGIGCSQLASSALFGSGWRRDSQRKLLYCGIDVSAFADDSERQQVRDEFGFAPDDCVLGHVGRFSEQKNHRWMIAFFRALIARRPKSRLLLIGDGPLRAEITEHFDRAGLSDRVVMAGSRRDVPRLMSGMDAFLLPSLFEGLPIVLLEAQAAGLPCLISDSVDPDAAVVTSLVHRLSLAQPIGDWIEAFEHMYAAPAQPRKDAWKVVADSPFNINVGVKRLQRLYEEHLSCEADAIPNQDLTAVN